MSRQRLNFDARFTERTVPVLAGSYRPRERTCLRCEQTFISTAFSQLRCEPCQKIRDAKKQAENNAYQSRKRRALTDERKRQAAPSTSQAAGSGANGQKHEI